MVASILFTADVISKAIIGIMEQTLTTISVILIIIAIVISFVQDGFRIWQLLFLPYILITIFSFFKKNFQGLRIKRSNFQESLKNKDEKNG